MRESDQTSQEFERILKGSERIQKNSKDPMKIQLNPKESEKIKQNRKEYDNSMRKCGKIKENPEQFN